MLIDINQTDTQYGERVDLLGSVGFVINDHQTVQLTGQIYRNESDGEYDVYFGENSSGLFGDINAVTTSDGFSSLLVPATKCNYLTALYQNDDFLGQTLMLQAFYRDEDISFYPQARLNKDKNPSTVSPIKTKKPACVVLSGWCLANQPKDRA